MSARTERLHASTVAIDGAAILIRGPSGAGKSSLALRLIDRGAVLVADDQTIVEHGPTGLTARAPRSLAGRIEVRGLGIVEMPALERAPLALVVDLTEVSDIARMPEADALTCAFLGRTLARVAIDAADPAAAARVRLALSHLGVVRQSRSTTLVSPPQE